MTIRRESRQEKTLDVDNIHSREELRKFILMTYVSEDCNTKLRYYVETLGNGKRIYIERPAQLNKGCDFVVFVEDLILYKNGNDKPPKHDDVLNDLRAKKGTLTIVQYEQLKCAIESIYNLEQYNNTIQYTQTLPTVGWDYEVLLKLLRWLFIEQDVTYWSGNGREMLYSAILSI